MRVFISWSGSRSRDVALAIHQLLPDVIQAVDPWMSDANIDGGQRWSNEIAKALDGSNFGIVCVTRDNFDKSWLNFEAGALAKRLESAKVCPLYLDGTATDYTGPLTQFQMKATSKDGVFELVQSVNKAVGDAKERAIENDRLARLFSQAWPTFEATLAKIEPHKADPARDPTDMLRELLELARRTEQTASRVLQLEQKAIAWLGSGILPVVTALLGPQTAVGEKLLQSFIQTMRDMGVLAVKPLGDDASVEDGQVKDK